MAEIFINYRRVDSSSVAGRLFDRLTDIFGREIVFLDRDGIEPGANFPNKIREAIQVSTVVVVVIGQKWLSQLASDGTRRLDLADDYVRREIEIALENKIKIIPVLVEGALMPSTDDLPASISQLVFFNAHELSDRRWTEDVNSLIQSLIKNYGIEPIKQNGAPPNQRHYANIGWYFSTLIDLIQHPTKALLSRNLGRRNDFPDAITFGLSTVALVTVLLAGALPTKKDYWEMIFVMPIIWAILTFMFSVPLYISWRLVCKYVTYRRIGTIFFYQAAVVAVAIHLFIGIFAITISICDPAFGDKLLVIMRESIIANQKFAAIDMMTLDLMQNNSILFAIGVLMSFTVVTTAIGWLLISWGVYRRIIEGTHFQSVCAFVGFVFLALLPPYFFVWIALWVNTP